MGREEEDEGGLEEVEVVAPEVVDFDEVGLINALLVTPPLDKVIPEAFDGIFGWEALLACKAAGFMFFFCFRANGWGGNGFFKRLFKKTVAPGLPLTIPPK